MQCCHSTSDLSAPDHSESAVTIPIEWSCPHDAVDGYNRCMFHLSGSKRDEAGITDDEVRSTAEQIITDPTEHSELIGAHLPGLELSNTAITGQQDDKLDLRCSNISGELKLENTRVDLPVVADGSTIDDGIDFTSTTFEHKVNFYGSRFKGASESTGVDFRGKVIFSRILSSFSLRLRDSTIFEKTAVFSKLKIKGSQGTLDFRQMSAKGAFYCRDINVPRLNCREAIFEGVVGMNGAHIRGDALFKKAHFGALARFGKGDRKRSDDSTVIEGETELKSVLADQTIGFQKVKFKNNLDLSGGSFERAVEFTLISLTGDIKLQNANFGGKLILKPLHASADEDSKWCTVTVNETTVSAGTLAQAGHQSSVPIRYDIVDSTIGNVSFSTPELSGAPYNIDNYTYYRSDLQNVRFIRTKFTGFDFTSYRTGFEGHWILHTFRNQDSVSTREDELKPVDLELTYMYAKQGADKIGDNFASSKFFQREMDYRTQRLQAKEEPTLNHQGQYLGLRLWGLIDYTENPRRVFGLGVGTAMLFSGLYVLLSAITGAESPYSDAPFGLGYFIFSGESFISLVHAPGASVTYWPLRLLSVVEGFFGAFIIALFVFSLTRAVHR